MRADDIRTLEDAARGELGEGRHRLGTFLLVALAGGAITGVVAASFRLVLREAERLRVDAIGDLRPLGLAGWLVPMVAVAVCAAAARALVRLAPEAGGSGVQRVEAVMRGQAGPAPWGVLPVKFLGGSLALGSGMVLGREGPSVQMGATIGEWLAQHARFATLDLRRIQAATAGAGLAVAFSAPIGGAAFVFEEVARTITLRLALATLVACSTAIAVAWSILGTAPVYELMPPPPAAWAAAVPFIVLGALLGALGVLYNRFIVVLLDAAARLRRVPPEAIAAVIGAVVGLCLRIEPDLVGGGDLMTNRVLDGDEAMLSLLGLLALRWFLGPWSYAAGAPGGIFAPLLLVGALFGTLFATALNDVLPALALDPVAFGIVGMSTFFAAVVRAPLTGILLVVEMTATTTQAVPMLAAAAAAVGVATLLGGLPIYDTLRLRMLRSEAVDEVPAGAAA